jgi:hypothetical protein
MRRLNVLLYVILAATMTISYSCGGGGSSSPGTTDTRPSVATAVHGAAPIDVCPSGGIQVDAGIDENGNGILDASEIDSSQYVCNGANGLAALVLVSDEAAGPNCSAGGKKISVGSDTNGNGSLDTLEITSSDYICNGAGGNNGINALVNVTTEPTGTNCSNGGLKVESGTDANGNTVLDPGEIASTSYVCNGAASVVIQSITANPPVLRPGETATLSVSANDGAGSVLTYAWSAAQGILSAATASVTGWTAPNTVGAYQVSVTVSNGASTVTGYATVPVSVSPAGPVITNVSPARAWPGDEIAIIGAGFGSSQGTSQVTIGGQAAAGIVSWSDTKIRALVPTGASTDEVLVTAGAVTSSSGSLTVLWPDGNVALSSATDTQYLPQIVSDAQGGAIVVWQDMRNGVDADIYAQRIDGEGNVLWDPDGVVISTATNSQQIPQIASDGAGGAIISWADLRNGTDYDIYAQRVDGSGTIMWTAGGVSVSAAIHDQTSSQLVADGRGGAVITWSDKRNGTDIDIYAQRIDSAGAVQWTTDGVVISAATGSQQSPQIVSDGSGGAIIAWWDYRNGTTSDIYAQRIDVSGVVQWAADGVVISDATNDQAAPAIATDGHGGAIIAWNDRRGGTYYDIYAQRVDDAGTVQWTANGIVIATASYTRSNQRILSDGLGGAIIAWQDYRSGMSNADIYAQRVNMDGSVLWTANGVALSTASGHQYYPRLVGDGGSGAIISWIDNRDGMWDAYAQHVNSSGVVQWTTDGMAVSSTPNTYSFAVPCVEDGSGGAIFTWVASYGGEADIYAQGVPAAGVSREAPFALRLSRPAEADCGKKTGSLLVNGSRCR